VLKHHHYQFQAPTKKMNVSFSSTNNNSKYHPLTILKNTSQGASSALRVYLCKLKSSTPLSGIIISATLINNNITSKVPVSIAQLKGHCNMQGPRFENVATRLLEEIYNSK
jgi:hypothetical protein